MRTDRSRQAALIAEQKQSGEPIHSYCARKGISVPTFRRWQKNSGLQALADEAGTVPFVRLSVMDTPARPSSAPCVIRVGKDILIECLEHTHPLAIEQALKAALRVCGRN